MANTRVGYRGTPDGSLSYEEISVDTDPGADGYASKQTSAYVDKQMWFYIKSITGTVTLQWKRGADVTWTDYEDYTEVTRKIIEDSANGMQWRVLVKDNNQNAVTGIDW